MSLDFRVGAPTPRKARGMGASSLATYCAAYAGSIEYGHNLEVVGLNGRFWRWSVYFSAEGPLVAEELTERAAREALDGQYISLLACANLREMPNSRDAR
jgi:hypothetical protein